ncbi:MAG TPA: imidazolonepropionase [Bryobacteraceae bacterium]|jgi:imidazolonepropionase|nr:imidazolonepropionase [Bryobacteraceae bacterium]
MGAIVVYNCRQLVTLAGPRRARRGSEMRDLGVISDGAMLIRDGRVEGVGTQSEIMRAAGGFFEAVDAGGRVVLPGFVDAHTHPVFAGTRADEFQERMQGVTYAEIAARGGGIRSTVRLTRAASEEELLKAARRYRTWFLRGGTTTVEAKSGYGLSLEDELKMLRVVARLSMEGSVRYVPTFLGAHEIPDEYRGRTEAYRELLTEEMIPRVASEHLAESFDAFIEPSVFPVEEVRPVLQAAQRAGFRLRLHADQFSRDYGSMLAAELGADTADHLESTSEQGMKALDAAGVMPVLLPASVYALGSSHYPAARQMIDLGMPVVLATDFNPGSSPTASMPMVLSLAATQLKMTAAEAITAATINAAYSLRQGAAIGSLDAGKRGDFAIHDCDDYRELPYFFGRDSAVAVYLAGTCIYKNLQIP